MKLQECVLRAVKRRPGDVISSHRKSGAFQAAVATMMVLMLAGPRPSMARHHRHEGGAAGEFDFYLLSLSWSPAFCLQTPGSPECNGPRRFGFIVHGLWPQNERGWPQNCGGGDVPAAVVEGIQDVIPSPALVQHEWKAHGTCSGLDPVAFFALVRRAHASLTIPAPLAHPGAEIEQSPAAITQEFLAANPRLPPDAVVTTCSRQGVPRLREVHICFTRELGTRACSPEALREACRAPSVIVPPIR